MTDTDERVVLERLETVSQLLQALRSRSGGPARGARPEDPAVSSIASFRARGVGGDWTAGFDEVLGELRALATGVDPAARTEVAQMIDYLIGVEHAVVRLAQSHDRRRRTPATASRFLSPSRLVPAAHPDERDEPTAARTFIEPLARTQLERSARDALEEVAALSALRRAADEDPWDIGADFERRLLECTDALASYRRGRARIDVNALSLRLARDYPVVEPTRWFAAAFLLACTTGDWAKTELRQLILDAPPSTASALVDAICLGASSHTRAIAVSLLDEDDRPDVLAIGLASSVRLGLFDEDRMAPLILHPSDALASLAARALSRGEPKAMAPRLAPLLNRPGVALDAAFVLTLFKAEVGLQHLRAVVNEGLGVRAASSELADALCAARVVALAGRKRDEDLLLRVAERADTALEALADHGSPAFLPYLSEQLTSSPKPARVFTAAYALSRMTGTPMRATGDDGIDQTFDAAVFAKRAAAFQPPHDVLRLRYGRPLDLDAALGELASPSTSQSTRRRAADDAALMRGAPIDLDLEGWVVEQRQALQRARRQKESAA